MGVGEPGVRGKGMEEVRGRVEMFFREMWKMDGKGYKNQKKW